MRRAPLRQLDPRFTPAATQPELEVNEAGSASEAYSQTTVVPARCELLGDGRGGSARSTEVR